MIDRLLPVSLKKMMQVALVKFDEFIQFPSDEMIREIAAVKCVLDFRIAFYALKSRYSLVD